MRGVGLELAIHVSTMVVALVGVATCTPKSANDAPRTVSSLRPERTHSGRSAGSHAGHDAPLGSELAARTAILVALDGVRWQEVFNGVDARMAAEHGLSTGECVDAAHLVPHLHRLMTTYGAAVGAPGGGTFMAASGPNFVSLPGYMEMLTGRSDSGCTNNQCSRVPFSTIAEDVAKAGLGPSVAVTSWESIELATAASPGLVFVSAGRHAGSGRANLLVEPTVGPLIRAAEQAPPNPGNEDFRPDAYTSEIAAEVFDSIRPGFLFVGLGETDEYAHRNDYRGYLRALRAADAAVGTLAEMAFRATATGHPTTLFITTDHGRQENFISHGREYPESARVWLVAAGAGIEARGFVGSRETRRLSDLNPTIRRIVGLPPLDVPRAGDVLSELLARSPVAER